MTFEMEFNFGVLFKPIKNVNIQISQNYDTQTIDLLTSF